jgi:hypothetical protein
MHTHMMVALNKNLSQNRLILLLLLYNMDNIEPIPKPPEEIKIKNIVHVKHLDSLFTTEWKNKFFNK